MVGRTVSRTPKVGVRQWRMLCALDNAAPLPTSVGSLMTLAGITDSAGSVLDGIRGMVNRGLLRHVCPDGAPCLRSGASIGRHCWIEITETGRNAVPTRIGRRGPNRTPRG